MGTPFGFPDWQNQRPLDGPLLLDLNAAVGLHSNAFGPVYVGRWARIAGDAFILTQSCAWTFTWYADQAATKQLGQRVFFTHNSIGVPLKFMLPNLGPWVRVLYTAGGAGNITITHHLYGTNREPPLEITPVGPSLVDYGSTAIAAGATKTDWFSDYYAGPAMLYLDAGAVSLPQLSMVIDAAGTLRTFWRSDFAAAGRNLWSVELPPTACQFTFQNNAGAPANFVAKLIPSYTGA